jgi:ParB/RepB/Spo0J family partition protein
MTESSAAPASRISKEAAGITKRSSAFNADPTAIIRREGWNPRFDFGEINELAKSIRVNGLLQPLRVKRLQSRPSPDPTRYVGKEFELIDGDRRLSAIEQLLKEGHGFPEGVPVIIVDRKQDDLTSLIQMFESNTGKPFTPIEEANAYKRMKDAGMSMVDICAKVGRAHMHVRQIMNLLEAAPEVQQAVASGEIGKSVAKEIATNAKGDPKKQKELVEKAKAVGSKKDAAGRREIKRELEKSRIEKAQRKGKTIKALPLSAGELSKLGASVGAMLAKKLVEAKVPNDGTEEDIYKWAGADDKLAAAFTFGALQALKAAAGVQGINLDI